MKIFVGSVLCFAVCITMFTGCCGGCPSVTDSVTERIREEVEEEVQEEIISEITGGNVDFDEDDSTVTIRGEDGEELVIDVDERNGSNLVTIRDEQGNVAATYSDNPDFDQYDFDQKLIYPDYEEGGIGVIEDSDDMKMFQIHTITDDDYDVVLEYYKSLRGWREVSSVEQPDGAFISLANTGNDNIIAQVVIAKEGGGRIAVGISYSEDLK
ncbi:MAG: hypothetical protein APR63_09365 [Desulfuromonas sp. SDB]|nr:MAG: hypothetical protein APR63_09365 [Desulfuromonas sp. SDB]